MWHTHEVMSKRPDNWTEIEQWVERQVTQELLSKKSFRKDYPEFSYSLSAARRVLFWDDIKLTATSPKADVRDSFDQEWKIKWGEESVGVWTAFLEDSSGLQKATLRETRLGLYGSTEPYQAQGCLL